MLEDNTAKLFDGLSVLVLGGYRTINELDDLLKGHFGAKSGYHHVSNRRAGRKTLYSKSRNIGVLILFYQHASHTDLDIATGRRAEEIPIIRIPGVARWQNLYDFLLNETNYQATLQLFHGVTTPPYFTLK
ncbi:MAG: hypothetical protein NTX24_03625 [Candidatus Pacearchaeota archaeon]|nr:hypothetical protein [Candidatus Pacearchaeota archaeon]